MDYKSFIETIEGAKKIILFSHVNPDGDTLGTMCALNRVLKQRFGKEPVMATSGKLPEIYMFLPESDKIVNTDNLDANETFDLAIALDIAAKDRMTSGVRIFDNAKTRINVDHHKTNNNFGDLNFVRADAACAGEVLFDIFENTGIEIDAETAKALYTAFMTDTGGFRYDNTKAATLTKAAKLIETGADPAKLARLCYDSKPKAMVLLRSCAISNAKFEADDRIAYACVSLKDMKTFNAENDHTEGLAEALRQIVTTEVAFVVKEVDDNTTKVSLRSKNIDVSKIATIYGGGGHTFAAGCTIRKPLKIACDKLLEAVKTALDE